MSAQQFAEIKALRQRIEALEAAVAALQQKPNVPRETLTAPKRVA